ncbi:MAG: hypothetical protein R3E87_24640 [Burkholderiaceae bacterium]
MTLIDQFPRLSAYDPGAVGEGGLDPLGLGAIADRIAEVLAPGLRARMSLPHLVTVTAVGAMAYQSLHDLRTEDGKTTIDIAFEWLVVEAVVRHAHRDSWAGLPGIQKAARAKASNERLSSRTYLNGPRVFGFTGVYRPFSRDAGVLTLDDLPAENAALLVRAWEKDSDLRGFSDGIPSTRGGQLRKNIADACKRSLEKAECAAREGGNFLETLAAKLWPATGQKNEKRVLRGLIDSSQHDIRNDLAKCLLKDMPHIDASQRMLAKRLEQSASRPTQIALQAAFDYEEAATVLDNAFRRFLAYTTQQHGSVISRTESLKTPYLEESARKISGLVSRAIDSVDGLADERLSRDTAQALELFKSPQKTADFLDSLISRHEEVQQNKKKLPWIEKIGGDWTVRTPYRDQSGDLDDEVWVHPMRITTLANFLRRTA